VNFDNDETIEFRMFQSSTRITNVLGYIEFIACLIQWCETDQTSLEWTEFCSYAMQSEFTNLKVFLTSVKAIAA
jgi:hypothetical protein